MNTKGENRKTARRRRALARRKADIVRYKAGKGPAGVSYTSAALAVKLQRAQADVAALVVRVPGSGA